MSNINIREKNFYIQNKERREYMRFDESFINEVKDKNDIVEVVSAYTSLKRSGNNYTGLCPFHSEKTPSFSVSSEKQLYYCFGCGAGGTVINFIESIENLDFVETVKFLAQRAGIGIPEESSEETEESRLKKKIYEMNKIAGRAYFNMLNSESGKTALMYLRNRGLSDSTITKYGLGYSPDSWDYIYKTLKGKGYRDDEIVKSGLCRRSEKGRIYDFFKNRVMFPVMDVRGNVIAFGGRDMTGSSPSKYLNTGDTPVFKKRENLFNLNIAKNTKKDYIILAEGYMDVISLYQAGFTNAVASLGTSFAPEHSRLLKRYTDKVIISFDGDSAGREAALRASKILKKEGLKFKILRIKDAKDPDELIKKFGAEAYQYALDSSLSGVEYDLENVYPEGGFAGEEEKVEYIKSAADILKFINSEIELEVYINKVASQTGLSPEKVRAFVNQKKRTEKRFEKRSFENNIIINKKTPEQTLIKIITENPSYFPLIKDKIKAEDFSDELNKKLYINFKRLNEKGIKTDIPMIFEGLDSEEAKKAGRLFIDKEPVGDFMSFFNSLMEKINEEKEKFDAEGDLNKLNEHTKQLREKYKNKAISETGYKKE